MTEVVFAHEGLIVWQRAAEMFRYVAELDLTNRPFLEDQLLRSANSVKANIAEGAGEFAPREKARFYRMALRSSTEVASHLDTCGVLHIGDASTIIATRRLLGEITKMLTTMVVNIEDRGRSSQS